MKKPKFLFTAIFVLLIIFVWWLYAPPVSSDAEIPQGQAILEQGEYLVHAAGCISCHINPEGGEALSGGQALVSDFGVFYVPNITPDNTSGIGGWSGADFIRALKHGRSPGNGFYYPAFPYRSYRSMTDDDVLAIAAYLMAQPPVPSSSLPHELQSGLSRWLMAFWNKLADISEPTFQPLPDEQLRRGAYLARSLGHCGECHTPRNNLGIPDYTREFSGAPLADGEADDISAAALEEWSEEDFAFFLFLGLKPDGEYVGGEMEAVIEHNTSPLSEEDREALAAFFLRGQESSIE